MKCLAFTLCLLCLSFGVQAQPASFQTRKLTDNVYVFRYGGHQSLFVVTPDGVIATDPIAYLRPIAATTYIQEIRKITPAPIRYLDRAPTTRSPCCCRRSAFFSRWTSFRSRPCSSATSPTATCPTGSNRSIACCRSTGKAWCRAIPMPAAVWARKEDLRALKQYMLDLSEATRNAADRGRCFDDAMREVRLHKYEQWGSYKEHFPMNVQRFCEYWGRGY
jgi:hypothetical protein